MASVAKKGKKLRPRVLYTPQQQQQSEKQQSEQIVDQLDACPQKLFATLRLFYRVGRTAVVVGFGPETKTVCGATERERETGLLTAQCSDPQSVFGLFVIFPLSCVCFSWFLFVLHHHANSTHTIGLCRRRRLLVLLPMVSVCLAILLNGRCGFVDCGYCYNRPQRRAQSRR